MIEPTAGHGGPDEIVPFLLERIRRGRCILLLGPEVAIDPARPEAAPLGLDLAARLADDDAVRATGLVSERDRKNLRYVAEAFERAHDRDEIERTARAFYGGLPDAATELHRNLAALPFALCVTTSPDAMMEKAFRLAGKQPHLAHYNFRRQLEDPAQGTEGAPLVYQLYGSTADPESLVLTETDLVDFLVGVVKNEPALPRWMRALIGKKSTEFLFVGIGFQNWYVRVLLHVLGVMEAHERPAWALEDRTFFEHPECAQNVGFFRRSGGGIKFFELGWNELAARLRAAHEVPPPAAAAAAAPAAGGPLAFLSYASEDEPSVSALAAQLERRGVQVWQDRQRLRGGDRWEQALKHVIGKEVNYFVPVQSQRMVARAEGVFYQEIRWALGRQERMPDRARFVVPATVDGATLESLREVFHVVDLRPGAGVEALASAILEDWSLRARATAA